MTQSKTMDEKSGSNGLKEEPEGEGQEERFRELFALTAHTPKVSDVWGIQELSEKEADELQVFLFNHYDPETVDDDKVKEDYEALKQITAEVKGVRKQSVLLIGERIYRARELLRHYDEHCFSKWLEYIFNSRQTAYNALHYYELYNMLNEEELRVKMRSMPLKAAYTLASREGPMEVKTEILRFYKGEKQKDTIEFIQARLPLASNDKRKAKAPHVILIDRMRKLSASFKEAKPTLNEEQKKKIQQLVTELQALI